MILCDVLCKIDDPVATVVGLKTVKDANNKWNEIVKSLLHDRHSYNRNDRLIIKDSVADSMVSNGTITQAQLDRLRVELPRLRYGNDIKIRSRIKELLGKDYRGEVYKVDTFPWSQHELKNFLVVRTEYKEGLIGSTIYWKRDLGLDGDEISQILSTATIWNPKYGEVCNARYFSRP